MPRTCLFKARAFQGRIGRLHFISGNRAGGFGNRARVVAVFPLQAATANFCLLPRKKNIFCAAGDIKVLSFMDRNFVDKRILLGKIPLILPQAILSVKNPNHKFKGSSGKRK